MGVTQPFIERICTMRTALISLVTPYKENVRGTSALAFHLLGGWMSGFQSPQSSQGAVNSSIIYTYNANGLTAEQMAEVEQELGVEIRLLSLPRWYRWLFKFHLLFLRVFFKYPFVNFIRLPQSVVDEIKSLQPDMIWVYGEEMSRIPKQFPDFRRIQIGPDVESLYYYRMMSRRFVINNVVDYWKCAIMYRKYARMERELCSDDNYTYYAVGEADIEHLRQIAPNVHSKFLRHPHYAVAERGAIRFHLPKIRLLVAGQYNLYMQQTADEVLEYIQCTMHNAQYTIRDHYSITFLGKGWERHMEVLRNLGFEVEQIKFAPDYIDEIIKHDIQVTPITVGTGTKGKVLDALANGLLVLGTPYAMENIAVEHGTSCVIWETPEQLVETLMDIPTRVEHYEQLAQAGREAVLEQHDPVRIAKQLFEVLPHADLADVLI